MKKNVAHLLVNHSDSLTLSEGYSGRGMFGKTTYAVIADSSSGFHDALASVVDAAIAGDFNTLYENQDDAGDIVDFIRDMRSDNMGMGLIYY